jgi:hypothetical protein
MADPTIFQVEDGLLALEVVDTTETGYDDSWQAPGGKTVDTVTEADYDTGSATWKCQVTNGGLTAEAQENNVDVPATFCAAARTIPQPGQTTYTLEGEFLQDVYVANGLSRYLVEHDTEEAYFFLGLDGVNPPRAIGRVRLIAGSFGGEARTTLTSDLALPLTRKPQIEFGTTGSSAIVPPNTPLVYDGSAA